MVDNAVENNILRQSVETIVLKIAGVALIFLNSWGYVLRMLIHIVYINTIPIVNIMFWPLAGHNCHYTMNGHPRI